MKGSQFFDRAKALTEIRELEARGKTPRRSDEQLAAMTDHQLRHLRARLQREIPHE